MIIASNYFVNLIHLSQYFWSPRKNEGIIELLVYQSKIFGESSLEQFKKLALAKDQSQKEITVLRYHRIFILEVIESLWTPD